MERRHMDKVRGGFGYKHLQIRPRTVQPIIELFVGGVNVYMGKRAVSALRGD